MLGRSYYDEAMDVVLDLKRQYGPSDLRLWFDIQTNGTLIDQSWCDFFKARGDVLNVGVSCDGPAFLHDAHRKSWTGRPTHDRTIRGLQLLCDNDIDFDVIAVVSPESLDCPDAFFDFFRTYQRHIKEFHFNLLDEIALATQDVPARDAYAEKYSAFLKSLLEAIRAYRRVGWLDPRQEFH